MPNRGWTITLESLRAIPGFEDHPDSLLAYVAWLLGPEPSDPYRRLSKAIHLLGLSITSAVKDFPSGDDVYPIKIAGNIIETGVDDPSGRKSFFGFTIAYQGDRQKFNLVTWSRQEAARGTRRTRTEVVEAAHSMAANLRTEDVQFLVVTTDRGNLNDYIKASGLDFNTDILELLDRIALLEPTSAVYWTGVYARSARQASERARQQPQSEWNRVEQRLIEQVVRQRRATNIPSPHWGVCSNCDQWQSAPRGDCYNECAHRGFATAAPPPEWAVLTSRTNAQGAIVERGVLPAFYASFDSAQVAGREWVQTVGAPYSFQIVRRASFEEAAALQRSILTAENLRRDDTATIAENRARLAAIGWSPELLVNEAGRRMRERIDQTVWRIYYMPPSGTPFWSTTYTTRESAENAAAGYLNIHPEYRYTISSESITEEPPQSVPVAPPRLAPANVYMAVRVDHDNGDVHVALTPLGPGVTRADVIAEVLDVAIPDEGAIVEWVVIEANSPEEARLTAMSRGRVQADAIDWRPVAPIILNAWHRQREYAQDREEQADADQAEAAADGPIYVIEGIGVNEGRYFSSAGWIADLTRAMRFDEDAYSNTELPPDSQWSELWEAQERENQNLSNRAEEPRPFLVLRYIEEDINGEIRNTHEWAEPLVVGSSEADYEETVRLILSVIAPEPGDARAITLEVNARHPDEAMRIGNEMSVNAGNDDAWRVVPDRIIDQYFRSIGPNRSAPTITEYSRIFPPMYHDWYGETIEIRSLPGPGQDPEDYHVIGSLPFAVYRRREAELLNEIRPWLDDLYRTATHSLSIQWEPNELYGSILDRFQHNRPIYAIYASPTFQERYRGAIEDALRRHGTLDRHGTPLPLEIERETELNTRGEVINTGFWTDRIINLNNPFLAQPAWAPWAMDRIGYEGYDYRIDTSPSVKTFGLVINNEERAVLETTGRSMIETTLEVGEDVSINDTQLAIEMTEYFPTMSEPYNRDSTFRLLYVSSSRVGVEREWEVQSAEQGVPSVTIRLSDNISEPRLLDLLARAELIPRENTLDRNNLQTSFHRQLTPAGRREDGEVTVYDIEDVSHDFEGNLVNINHVGRLVAEDFSGTPDVNRVDNEPDLIQPTDEGTLENPIYVVHVVSAEENALREEPFRNLPEELRIIIANDPTIGHYVWRSRGGSEDTVRYTVTQIRPPRAG